MLKFMANAKVVLWEFVELGFVTILAIMLIYLILGQGSGVFVTSVADNVTKFASGVPTQSLIGLALVWVHLPHRRSPAAALVEVITAESATSRGEAWHWRGGTSSPNSASH
jgi:hypothetical protein